MLDDLCGKALVVEQAHLPQAGELVVDLLGPEPGPEQPAL
jgi:hypothetical protein